jgi:hypothetical protein
MTAKLHRSYASQVERLRRSLKKKFKTLVKGKGSKQKEFHLTPDGICVFTVAFTEGSKLQMEPFMSSLKIRRKRVMRAIRKRRRSSRTTRNMNQGSISKGPSYFPMGEDTLDYFLEVLN